MLVATDEGFVLGRKVVVVELTWRRVVGDVGLVEVGVRGVVDRVVDVDGVGEVVDRVVDVVDGVVDRVVDVVDGVVEVVNRVVDSVVGGAGVVVVVSVAGVVRAAGGWLAGY